jgi:nicotinate-nucleotide--dimethylbenzimidazole phosphoribosyltransferase
MGVYGDAFKNTTYCGLKLMEIKAGTANGRSWDQPRATGSELWEAAWAAMDAKVKPPRSLGRLESWAVQLAVLQGTLQPRIGRGRLLVFAADHGIVDEGVSAYPRSVTAEMMRTFSSGGAAITVLARSLGLEVEVIDVGVDADLGALDGVTAAKVRRGSTSFVRGPALQETEVEAAWEVGREAVRRARADGVDALGLGEMGIGNTTVAAALLAALVAAPAAEVAGRGTGVDDEGLQRKRDVIEAALERHRAVLGDPRRCLSALGGLEIVSLAGAATEAARLRMAAVVDGFISTVAALVAVRIEPAVRPALFFAHRSTERGHGLALQALEAEPLLDLGMRLGEGTGAALALPILRAAADLLRDMATFEEAGVSQAAGGDSGG